jgi:hypothetical protein
MKYVRVSQPRDSWMRFASSSRCQRQASGIVDTTMIAVARAK